MMWERGKTNYIFDIFNRKKRAAAVAAMCLARFQSHSEISSQSHHHHHREQEGKNVKERRNFAHHRSSNNRERTTAEENKLVSGSKKT
jgi:hypothetical protein